MEATYLFLNRGIERMTEYSILLLDFIGVCVFISAAGRTVYELVYKMSQYRLHLAEGIALALEFKLGAELLRTGLVRDWRELLIFGALFLLRGAITLLIRWEIRIEKGGDPIPARRIKRGIKKSEKQDVSPPDSP